VGRRRRTISLVDRAVSVSVSGWPGFRPHDRPGWSSGRNRPPSPPNTVPTISRL